MIQIQSHDEYVLTAYSTYQRNCFYQYLPEMSLMKDEQLINLCSLYSAEHKDLSKVRRVVSSVYASDAVWEDPLVYMRGTEQVGVHVTNQCY